MKLTRRSLLKSVAAVLAAAAVPKLQATPDSPFAQWWKANCESRTDVSVLIYGPPKSGKSTLSDTIQSICTARRLVITQTDTIKISEVCMHDIVLFTRRLITPEFENKFYVRVRTNRFAPTSHIEFVV